MSINNKVKLDCVRDCQADCCRCLELSFPFLDKEAETLTGAGSVLERVSTLVGPLYRLKKCAFLENSRCLIHNKPEQPKCCRTTKPGSQTCLYARRVMATQK